MEKADGQEQQKQQPLKCPRCDSWNTKFCYYNNYSLSQPRHFCKGCKRYWTRGGTLRNVPVGGGCRKNNKRIIRRSSSASVSASSSSSPAAIDISSSSAPLQIPASTPPPQTKTQINPLFYRLPIAPTSELNPPFPRMFGSRVSTSESCLSGYDSNNSIISSTGFLGYSSSSSSNPLLSSYPVFRSSSSITTNPGTTSTTLTSLIASGGLIKDITNHEGCHGNFLGMPPYTGESLMAAGNIILENGELLKGVKMGGDTQNRSNWNDDAVPMNHQNLQTEGVVGNINYSASSSGPSFPWNGAWMDPSSISLI